MSKHQHRDRIATAISWGHWFTLTNIFLALLIGTLYLDSAEPTRSIIGLFYLFVSWVGHFAFLPFVFFIIFIFPLCILFPYSRFLRGVSAVLSSFALFILLIDALFFQHYSFHLNSYALSTLAADAEQWFSGGSFVLLIAFMMVFLLIFTVQLLLANLTWKKLEQLRSLRTAKPLPAIFIACFFLSHSIHIWADATLYRPITQQDDLFPASYPTTAKTLMTRQGWISIATYDNQRSALADISIENLRYPTQAMLCAPKENTQRALLVAFDEISPSARLQIEQALPSLTQFQGAHVVHPVLKSSTFQLAYGIPDRLLPAIETRGDTPAYLQSMSRAGYPVQWLRSEQWSITWLPMPLRELTQSMDALDASAAPVSILWASVADIHAVLTSVAAFYEAHPTAQIIITGLTPHTEAASKVAQRLSAPLWMANVEPQPDRVLSKLEDLMPSFFSQYLSCAESFKTFTNGIPLQRIHSSFPRVISIQPSIYIFENQKSSILHADGDVEVFDNEGNPLVNEEPSPAAVVDALKELQRFTVKSN
ncbi:MAG: protein of unknown function containing DUF3413 domain [Idiomarinaceae bacterium HL-53]|nr:MAG: protein of unknown function containing DUF3413 domain [Idiomarinaceae bacterium HL-53]CUS49062.1 hypothetical protein Ga0003345_2048 [Idiomarinaceae bacterium HL-53]